MVIISELWLTGILLALSTLVIALYYFLTSTYSYWKEKNVPFIKPVLGFGVSLDLILGKKAHAEIMADIYKQFEGERLGGFYQFKEPTLMIRDPKLIEQIMIKDFSHFEDRGLPLDENEPLTVNLVNLKGNQWRSLRQKLTPTFTSGKLKGMLQQMCNCGEDLLQVVDTHADTGEILDTKSLIFLFSSDVIASCAFGLQIKSGSSEADKFRKMVNKALGNTSLSFIRFAIKIFCPKLAVLFGIKSVPSDVSEYFMTLTKATIEHRLNHKVKRADFFQLLLTLKQQDDIGKTLDLGMDTIEQDDVHLQYDDKPASLANSLKFTEEIIAAQSFVFLAAGSESVSTTISVVLHHLAENPKVQNKLQIELDSVLSRHNEQWTYQALKDMTYLDQVIQESMRLFPIGHVHARVCSSTYKVPDMDLVIDKDTVIFIPTHGIQTDPTYYPNPEIYNPDRFVGNNFKPSSIYSPFGDGPRMCIAMRFAVLEMKVCIARIMSKFTVKQSSKTVSPLRYDPKVITNKPLGGIWLSFHRRDN